MEFRPILSALIRNKVGAILIAMQIAITLAIVTNAAFIIEQRSSDIARPSGLDEENTAFIVLTPFKSNVDKRDFLNSDLDALRGLPGVVAATPVNSIPVSNSGNGQTLITNPEQTSDEAVSLGNFNVDEYGLETFGLELLEGRNFRPDEIGITTLEDFGIRTKILVSRQLADALFPGETAVGKLVWGDPSDEAPTEIIGVFDQLMSAWPHSDQVYRTALTPAIDLVNDDMVYIIRSEPGQLNGVLSQAENLLAQRPGRLVRVVRTFEEQKKRTYSSDIAMVKLLSGVVVILTAVTGFGIVGLASFSVTQRRKQIGTRRALGAMRRDIMRYFMVENWIITTIGLLLGIFGTLSLNWFLDTEYQTGRLPLYYLPLGMVMLWLLGQLAVLAPAHRAAGIPPALATRSV